MPRSEWTTCPGQTVCVPGDPPVHRCHRFDVELAGFDGDLAADPRLDLPGPDPPPQDREPVPQVEGVADQHRRRRRRHPQLGTELGRAELARLRGADATEADQPLGTGQRRRTGRLDHPVQVGPVGGILQDRHLGTLPQRLHRRDMAQGGVGVEAGAVDVGVEHDPNLQVPTDTPRPSNPPYPQRISKNSRPGREAAATSEGGPNRRRRRPRRWRPRPSLRS